MLTYIKADNQVDIANKRCRNRSYESTLLFVERLFIKRVLLRLLGKNSLASIQVLLFKKI